MTMHNPNTNISLAPIETLELTQDWDKVFPKSDMVDHSKVVFVNRYGITLAADISWFGQTIPFGRQCRSLAPSA